MSEKTTPTAVPAEQPAEESSTDVTLVEKKPNLVKRVGNKIKSVPPKTALAVVGGTVLVVVAASLGRATASTHLEIVNDDFDPEPLIVTGDVVESTDTQTA
jgi:hypothetical protein